MKKIFFLSLCFLVLLSCKKQEPSTNPPTLGSTAPEISLNDANGKAISLSSLKGKTVIVSFWASWCPYCRKDNPNLVSLYNKYKAKGLEIYSVSLDTDKAAWEKAIKDDGLIWTNHVTDLKKWDSPAAILYEVNSTPTKFLIDKDGIVRVINFATDMTAELEKWL